MNPAQEALEALYGVLAGVEGVRLHRRGPGQLIDPPGIAVGPPKLLRELRGFDPSSAVFQVAVVVADNEHAMDELLRLEPLVAAAIDDGLRPYAVVGESRPGRWPAGGVDLPAYLIDVDYAL